MMQRSGGAVTSRGRGARSRAPAAATRSVSFMTKLLDHLTAALADRYRIEREIGLGGMATGYQAEDLKHKREVAIKVLRWEVAASLGPDRFMREIEIAARLQHPNIPTM